MIKKILNKKYIRLLSLVLLLILALVAVYYVDLNKFNSKFVKYNDEYLIKITYLVADKDQLDKNVTIEETTSDYTDSILYITSNYVPLTKDGDYLVADLDNFTNDILLTEVTDVIFTRYNVFGETIEGCSYDKESKTLKIPYSYYDEQTRDQYVPVQVEIESLLTQKEIKNIETEFSVKKLVTYNSSTSNELFQLNTKISLSNYINSDVSQDNIYVYLNNSEKPISKDVYSYNPKTKVLTIELSPLVIDKVDIKIGNNIIKNVFAITYVDSDEMNAWLLLEPPSSELVEGYIYTTSATDVGYHELIYCADGNEHAACAEGYVSPSKASGTNADNFYYSYFKDYYGVYSGLDSSKYINMLDAREYALNPYLVNVDFVGDGRMVFNSPDEYLIMSCAKHDYGSATSGYGELKLEVKVVEKGDDWMVLRVMTNPDGQSRQGWATQVGLVYFKVRWEQQSKCSMSVSKKVTTTSNDSGTGVATFELYDNGDCSGTAIQTKSTGNINLTNNSTGSVTFTDLTLNSTYSVRETSFVQGATNLLSNRYTDTTPLNGNNIKCTSFVASDSDGDEACDSPFTITNSQNKYCYSIKKVDAESSSTAVANTTWTLTGADGDVHTGTTNSSGIITFTDLKYQNYTLKETTSSPADLDNNGTLDYWNDNSTGVTINASSLTLGSTCNSPVTYSDKKVYYCIKVKKVDNVTGAALTGAEFTATKGNITITDKSSSNGITSFFIGDSSRAGNYTITETAAPSGYTIDTASKTVAAIPMYEYGSAAAAKTACFSDDGKASDGSTIASKTYNSGNNYVFKDKKILINWYKTTENGSTKVNGATFKVKNSSGQYITVSNPESQTDNANVTKACYKYTGANSSGTVMTSGANGSTNITMTGEVCVSGLPSGTYTVVEISAPQYHTFGSSSSISVTAGNTFSSMTNSNKLVNYPTEFKFTKRVTDVDGTQEGNTRYTITVGGVTKTVSLSEMTTEELMKIGFTIYDSNGNAVAVKEISSGHYEYGSNSIDQAGSSSNVTVLHLDSNREIDVKHLPKGNYTIKEVDTSSCGLSNGGYGTIANPTTRPSSAPSCANGGSSSGECIGYYTPDYSSNTYPFTIDDCSSTTASQNSTSCGTGSGIELQSLTNTPTEITFTKKDLYTYQNASDIIDNNREQDSSESDAEFENAKERSDFDRIDFKVKDSRGNYLNFIYVGNTSTTCGSDSDYSIYRYVPGLQLPSGVDQNVFNFHAGSDGLTITQTLHACGGHIKLINLCRGETYTFEEVKVPDDSVYVLEKAGDLNPSVCFEVPCSTNEEEHRTSTTAVINDKPTRVTFEKRDSKYNYLIPDETTTFEVYRCPKVDGNNTLCSPSSYSTVAEREAAGMKLIKFEPRSQIVNDEEDLGVEVYRMMSDSDAENKSVCEGNQTSNCYVTSVHPDAGKLVLRYLQSGYNYVLLETVAPANYMLPTGKGAETPFTVVNTTVNVEEVNVPNAPTALIIRKYADQDGDNQADSDKLLGGAKFRVYKVINYNVNLKTKDQEKELIKLKTIKDGVYENRPVLDTDVITTCSGESCSYTPASLGYDGSAFENIDDLIEASGDNITAVLREGTAIIQYLEYDTYYIIEEVEAPTGYSLPEKDDDRFTLVHIKKNETEILDTADALVNKPTSFTFYKFDEYNTPLDGATFYLQKLDQEKKYNTLTVSMETLDNGDVVYKADENSELTDITTTGGKATVYYLEPGQYRILEVKAPEGYELPKKTINVATFFVDTDGLVYGSNIITNKKPAETIEYLASDKAELIINIQTGKVVVKYGLIITVLIGAIVGLIIFLKKRK